MKMSVKEKDVKDELILELIKKMKRDYICLPSFQRDFVWEPRQMALLVESVIRHYPIGTFIFLRYLENKDLGKHSFVDTDPNAFKPKYYVIDGQQRLRTFWCLINKPTRFIPRDTIEHKGKKYKIYLRIDTDISHLSVFVDKPSFVIPQRTEEEDKENYEWQGEEQLIPIEFVLDDKLIREWFKKAFLKSGKRRTAKHKRYLKNVLEVRKRILSYKCPVEYIIKRLNSRDHTNIFKLLNEAGTDLTTFDLLNAQLSNMHINLRELWKDAAREYNMFERYDLDPIQIVKVLLLIRQTKNNDENPTCTQKDLRSLHKIYKIPDFYLEYQSEENAGKDFRQQFREDWKESCKYTSKALEIIQRDFGACQKKYIPYTPMIVVLAAIEWWRRDYDQRFQGAMKEKIRRWYWGSIFAQAYEASTDNVISYHYKSLIEWLAPGHRKKMPSELKFWMSKRDIEKAIDEIESSGDARYKSILCLPLVNNATDIYSHEFLSKNLHDHHIFPKKCKEVVRGEIEGFEINNVINRMLITDKTNQTIKNKSPYEYLDEKCCTQSILKCHFLFKEIAAEKLSYKQFYARRKKQIVNRLYYLINY
jgi:hypothetical protein